MKMLKPNTPIKIRAAHCGHWPGWCPCLSTSLFPSTCYTPLWIATHQHYHCFSVLYCHCNCSIHSTSWISNHHAMWSPNPWHQFWFKNTVWESTSAIALIHSIKGCQLKCDTYSPMFLKNCNETMGIQGHPWKSHPTHTKRQVLQKQKCARANWPRSHQYLDAGFWCRPINCAASKFKNTPWSPQLHCTYIKHWYWAMQASSLKTGRNYDHLLAQLCTKLGITATNKNRKHTIRSNLQCIQAKFWEIHKDAAEHCQKFLNDLMIAAKATEISSINNSSGIWKQPKTITNSLPSPVKFLNLTMQVDSHMF